MPFYTVNKLKWTITKTLYLICCHVNKTLHMRSNTCTCIGINTPYKWLVWEGFKFCENKNKNAIHDFNFASILPSYSVKTNIRGFNFCEWMGKSRNSQKIAALKKPLTQYYDKKYPWLSIYTYICKKFASKYTKFTNNHRTQEKHINVYMYLTSILVTSVLVHNKLYPD